MEKKARLLYVEDDPTLSLITKENLELYGYTVDFCDNGVTALEMISGDPYMS